MVNRENRNKKGNEDRSFYRLMLILSLSIHILLCLFFYYLQIPLLIIYNVASIILYLLLIIVIEHLRHIARWLILPFLEVIMHTVLCNACLGWGYGFSLYGLMIIPITYNISFSNSKEKNDIMGANILAFIDLVVIVVSCLEAKGFNQYGALTTKDVLHVFSINLIFCVLVIIIYSSHFVKEMRKATQILEERNEELHFYAHFDPVTNMRNRYNMPEVFRDFEKSGQNYCVVLGDIDNYKQINDTFGHICADELLVNLSYVIRQEVRNRGEVCRWGGDEILLLLKMDEKSGYQLVEKIRQSIKNFVLDFEGKKVTTTITFGFSFSKEEECTEKLISIADRRLYEGKRKGKNVIIRK